MGQLELESVCSIIKEIARSSPLNDEYGVFELVKDVTVSNIDVIVKLHREVVPKVNDILAAYNTTKSQLDVVNKELLAKQEELKSVKNCSKCVKLQNDLARSRKKLAVNEKRIKTIAKLLTRDIPCTEDVDRDYNSDDSSVSKAYNLVSQMLGCEPGADIGDGEEAPEPKAPCTVEESVCEDGNHVIICSVEEAIRHDKEIPRTPQKQIHVSKDLSSPILGKTRKTPLQTSYSDEACDNETTTAQKVKGDESILCIPPSPCSNRRSGSIFLSGYSRSPGRFKLKLSPKKSPGKSPKKSPGKSSKNSPKKSPRKSAKRKADFWELKTTRNVSTDSGSSGVGGKKLKQAQLVLGKTPEVRELCSLSEFNGGIRRSQTSTQVSNHVGERTVETPFVVPAERSPRKQHKKLEEDVIMDSPLGPRARSKQKSRLFQKVSLDGKSSKSSPNGSSITAGSCDPQRNFKSLEADKQQQDNFDELPRKVATSPKFKYRDGPVRKKDERKKLEGWDCESCKKYYEACGTMSENERKLYMNRCSRHRDKHPIRTNTPPGFWDAGFPETLALEGLNQTHTDNLFRKSMKGASRKSPTH